MDEHTLLIYMGTIGLVVIISGLVSGLVERGPLSQVLIFVALGVLVGPQFLHVIDLGIESTAINVVATISLVLVLFTDAIKVNLGQLRANWLLPAIALGPGALLTVAFIAVAGNLVLGMPWVTALLAGAVLASTDAVLLRDVTRDTRAPLAVRHTLSIEAGMNDAVVLPATLVLTAIASGAARSNAQWGEFAFSLFVLGPLVGVAVAYVCLRALTWLRRRGMIRRDYESLYSLGVAFTAFSAAQLLGGSGFIAAFAAGLTIAVLDVELCECFLEYGETTAEMAMLLTSVLVGAALVTSALGALTPATALFAALVLGVARPLAFVVALLRSRASWAGRLMIAWFGPRGLNSILLVILAASAGLPNSEQLFGIVSVVVLVSVVIHGASATPVVAWYGRRAHREDLVEETMADAGLLLDAGAPSRQVGRITPAELHRMQEAGEPVTVVDVRRRAAYVASGLRIPGAVRIEVDEIPDRANEFVRGRTIALYCA
ncbi:MAG: cation:proton antiporter [Chloroflexi bacterium]|nr:cation:proton antiporter [Chloroflexota bacterium]